MLADYTGLIGRDNELQQINNALVAGLNILIIAPKNFGKSTLFYYCRDLACDYQYFTLKISDTTFVESLKLLAEEYHAAYPRRFY